MKIGRYEFDPLSIVLTERDGDEWKVTLPYGVTLKLNAEEKAQLDAARELHAATLHVYGIARAAGLRA